MGNVRYVCLSDLHFGEDHSLFSNLSAAGSKVDYSKPSPVMVQFVTCLRAILPNKGGLEKRTLILNGDILELAFCEMNYGATIFRQFIELMMRGGMEPLFDEIIFIPGNHDHHLWEIARETQYLEFLNRHTPKKTLPRPWHTTSLFLEDEKHRIKAHLLTEVSRDYLKNRPIWIAYPNLALLNKDKSKCVVVHHGHFTENIYWLMSKIKEELFGLPLPEDVWNIEEENYAWIDFFWSALGRSGEAGRGLETIYAKLLKPETLEATTEKAADLIARFYDSKIVKALDYFNIVNCILNHLVKKHWQTERSSVDEELSKEAELYLRRYLEIPLRRHLKNRLDREYPETKNLPEEKPHTPYSEKHPETTFVYGHTHKPFCDSIKFGHYEKPVHVYNTGGWVVDTLNPEPCHGGAIVLIDDNLETVLLKVYNESTNQEKCLVEIDCATDEVHHQNQLFYQIKTLVEKTRSSWEDLSTKIAGAVTIRRERLMVNVEDPS
ncbi:MAG: metallophosphoesterase [Syntrophaceae bacterium]|nr:metallophosphoesterase [Syntrophaceae bacterium]